MWQRRDNQEVGLEAAIFKRKRNSSLVERGRAENITGLKHGTEALGVTARWRGRGALYLPVKPYRKEWWRWYES